jgi:hypothetical protein
MGCETHPLAQLSVCTALLTQRCRERRSLVHVHTLEVPEALPAQPDGADAHVSSTLTALSTQPFAQLSVCTMLITQRCLERRSLVHVHVGELPEALPVHVLVIALHVASAVPVPGTHEVVHALVSSRPALQRCRERPSGEQTQLAGIPPQFEGGTAQHVGQSYASMFVRPAQRVALQVFPPAAVHDGTHRPPWITYAGGGIGHETAPLSRGALASTRGALESALASARGALVSALASIRGEPASRGSLASPVGPTASRRLAESAPASRVKGTSSGQPASIALADASHSARARSRREKRRVATRKR